MVDYKVFPYHDRELCNQHITPESIAKAAQALSPAPGAGGVVSADDVIVDMSTMHYGMGARNPLNYIKFYSKHNPNSKYWIVICTYSMVSY